MPIINSNQSFINFKRSTVATLSILLDKYIYKRLNSYYKRVPFFVCLLLAQAIAAQDAAALINTEKAFAQLAKETSVRNAFLSYLDSNGVVFNKGKIINGLQQFASQQEDSNKLLWQPRYAAVSTSGDIGFTTGPYEVRRSLDSAAIAAGQYSSVWKRNATGEWKLLVDLGIDYKTSLFDSTASTTTIANHQPSSAITENAEDVENNFINSYKEKGTAAFALVIDEYSWFNLQNQHPFFGKAAITKALDSIPAQLRFLPVGGGFSGAGDMTFVYGNVEGGNRTENYLRVWEHTTSGWKILLQVIRW